MCASIIHKGIGAVTFANSYNSPGEKMNFSSKFVLENLVVSDFLLNTHTHTHTHIAPPIN